MAAVSNSADQLRRVLTAGRLAIGIEHLQRSDLQLALSRRGQSTSGSTAALAERLQQHLLETEVTSVWRVCHLAVAPRRSNPALLAYRGELYLFGGGAFNDHFVNSNNVLLKYSPDTGRFEGVGVAEGNTNACPDARAGSAVVAWEGRLWVFGGEDGYQTLNDMHSYDVSSGLWETVDQFGKIPNPRATCFPIVYQNCMLLYGYEDDGSGIEGAHLVSCFDFASGIWSRLKTTGPASQDQQHVQACALQESGWMYVLVLTEGSAKAGSGAELTMFRLDIEQRRWEEVETKGKGPDARVFFASAVLDDLWVVNGGLPPDHIYGNSSATNETFAFDFLTHTWSRLKPPPGALQLQSRSRHAAAVFHDSIVYAGGTWEDDDPELPSSIMAAMAATDEELQGLPEEWDRLIAHDTVECLQLLPLPPDPSPSGSLVNPRLVQSLRTARENGQLCDMQLVSSDGACFPAHWLIIAAQTPVLADAVQAAEGGTLVLEDYDSHTVSALVEYLYGKALDVPRPVLVSLFLAAKQFQLGGLAEEAEEQLSWGLEPSNAAKLAAFAEEQGAGRLLKACFKYAAESAGQVRLVPSPAFVEYMRQRPMAKTAFTASMVSDDAEDSAMSGTDQEHVVSH